MSINISFLGPETGRCGEGLPREGVAVKKFVSSLKSLSSLGFEDRNLRCPGNFAGMSRTPGGCSESSCAKKVCGHYLCNEVPAIAENISQRIIHVIILAGGV